MGTVFCNNVLTVLHSMLLYLFVQYCSQNLENGISKTQVCKRNGNGRDPDTEQKSNSYTLRINFPISFKSRLSFTSGYSLGWQLSRTKCKQIVDRQCKHFKNIQISWKRTAIIKQILHHIEHG